MEDTQLAEAAPISTAPAAPAKDAGNSIPQSVLDNLTVEQMGELLETGKVEIPPAGGVGEIVQEPPAAAKVEDLPPGEQPAKVVDEPAKVEEVVETRSAEQIQTDQAAAIAAVVEAGGDEAAQAAAAEAAAQPVAAQVDDAAAAAAAAAADEDPPERFRVKDPFVRAAMAIYKAAEKAGAPITLAEAESRARGPKVEAKAPAAAAPIVIQSTKIAETVKTLGDEVAALAQKIEDSSDEVLPTRELAKLTTEHATKSAQLAAAEGRLEDAKAGEKAALVARSAAARATATAEAVADWPDAADDTTPLAKAIAAEITALESEDHPDHSILWADSAPLVITQRVAKRLGIQPAAKKAAAPSLPAKPAVVAPPRKIVAPVTGGKTSVPATIQPAEDAKATIEKAKAGELSVEEMDHLQGGGTMGELLAGVAR